MKRFASGLAIVIAGASTSAVAHAEGGAAGRLQGDVALSAEGGVGSSGGDFAGTVQARALYLSTAGAYASTSLPFSDSAGWLASAGVEARPLFLPRFLQDLERNRDILNLTLDSISFGLGVAFAHRQSPALEMIGGVEIPFFAHYESPFLGARISYIASHDRQLGDGSGITTAFLTLGIRGNFWTHVVDAGDRVVR